MTAPHLQEDVTQLQTTVYGVHGAGGLVQQVEQLRETVTEHEKKLNAVSLKWLVMMLLAGALGNSAGSALLSSLLQTLK